MIIPSFNAHAPQNKRRKGKHDLEEEEIADEKPKHDVVQQLEKAIGTGSRSNAEERQHARYKMKDILNKLSVPTAPE